MSYFSDESIKENYRDMILDFSDDIEIAECFFNNVSEPELVDISLMQLELAKKKLAYVISRVHAMAPPKEEAVQKSA